MLPLQNVADSVVAELLKRGPISEAKLAVAWQCAVGGALARATTVRLGPRGVVRVSVADERWRHEVRRSSRLVLTRLQALLGRDVVTRIEIGRGAPEAPAHSSDARPASGSRTLPPESRNRS